MDSYYSVAKLWLWQNANKVFISRSSICVRLTFRVRVSHVAGNGDGEEGILVDSMCL